MDVLYEVFAERERQQVKWGEQNHSSVYPVLTAQQLADHYKIPTADFARNQCEDAFGGGYGTWTDILLEEFCEAVEAGASGYGEKALREELIQVAAVTVAWIEAIDRRNASR